jgi:mono/diheme cytochrome c family protein
MRELKIRALGPAAGLLLASLLLPVAARGQDAAAFFRQSCMSCHTIGGGRLVGPDLKHVTQRKDRAWLINFVSNPKTVLDGGDPYALQLKQEAGGAVMPPIANMSPARAEELLALVEAESKLPKSQFAGLQITDEPFTAADIARGKDLFTGKAQLARRGPACMSCHTVTGMGGLGGGRLGPDLTLVFERLKGRKALASWLLAPATATMQPVFSGTPLANEEILPLVAYFEDAARRGGRDDGSRLGFLLLGLGGAAVGLAAADGVWRNRFRAVRRPLLTGRTKRTMLGDEQK